MSADAHRGASRPKVYLAIYAVGIVGWTIWKVVRDEFGWWDLGMLGLWLVLLGMGVYGIYIRGGRLKAGR